MRDVAEAIDILSKYTEEDNISPGHDELWLSGPNPLEMNPADATRLEELSFRWDEEVESWHSFI